MTAMERLIAADEERRRLLRIERRPQQRQRLFGPILRRAFRPDAQIELLRCDKHPVGVLEAAGIDAVEPDGEGLAEGRARVCGVGQMKSAITVPPASTTRSHIQPMRRACSTRSSWLKPRSRERLARTASALNTTALSSGASALASVVLPAPGRPMMRIFLCTVTM